MWKQNYILVDGYFFFCCTWIVNSAGYLGDYLHSYPEVSLDVQIDNRKINLIQDDIDIALCFGLPENDNVVARKLTEIELGLFASPDYLAHKGQPKSPHELYGHMLLRRTHLSWQFSCKNHHVSVDGAQRLLSNDFNLIGQMVSDGAGIGLLPCFPNMVRPEWTRVLPEWAVEPLPVYLVYYRNRGNVAAVRSLVDFLLEKIEKIEFWYFVGNARLAAHHAFRCVAWNGAFSVG